METLANAEVTIVYASNKESALAGEFTLNRAYSWFEGNIDFSGNKVGIMLSANKNGKLSPKSFSHLKKFVEDIENRDSEIRKFIVKKL